MDDSDLRRELERVRRRNKQLKDSSSLALVELDMTGKIAGWNNQAEHVFGWTEEEALGRHFELIVPEPARPHVDVIFRALASGQVRHSRNLNVRKDGRSITCQWYNAVLRDDDGVVYLVYCEVRDVTEEEELRRRQQLMQVLSDRSPLGIFAKDPDGRYLYANEEFARSVGRSPAEIVGLDDFALFARDIAEDLIRHDHQVIAADATLTREDSGVGPDADRTYWSIKFPLHAADGGLLALCGIVNDITPLRQAERERVDLQQQVIDTQRAALAELSTPLLPVADGVLVMPLIGAVDSTRAEMIMEALLAGVSAQRAHTVILDITGVREIDTWVASALLRAAASIKLLGAGTILTGVGPAVAQTLVHLGVDLGDLDTRGSLRAGIAAALRRGRAR